MNVDRILYYESGHGNNVRGACEHRHRTVEAAQKCGDRDQRDCARAGGYSDRRGVYARHASGNTTGPYDPY